MLGISVAPWRGDENKSGLPFDKYVTHRFFFVGAGPQPSKIAVEIENEFYFTLTLLLNSFGYSQNSKYLSLTLLLSTN